jgi:hypothetical protein
MGLGGNVRELEETEFDLVNDLVDSVHPGESRRGHRGGYWYHTGYYGGEDLSTSTRGDAIPSLDYDYGGFRVASYVPAPAADFNGDGTVDAADYVMWRNGLNATYTQSDYDVWRAHFGLAAGSSALHASVPEPTSVSLYFLWLACYSLSRAAGAASHDPVIAFGSGG